METLYVSKDAKLERQDSTLLIRQEGVPKRRIPVETLRHVVVTGESGLTTSLLALLGRNDVRVTVLDWYGNVAGSFEPMGSPASGAVRLAQARHASEPDTRLVLAKTFVVGTMRNLRANLRYRAYRGAQGLDLIIAEISRLESAAQGANCIESLMGFEGAAKAWYYQAWPVIDPRLDFGPRVRRPPNNPLNCLISWFNGLLYSATRHEIAKTHLDGCIAFLHSSQEARWSLALDLSEAFKPVIADALIFEIVLRGRLDEAWFHIEDNVCRLSDAGRRATLETWVAKIDASDGETAPLRAAIRGDALALERHVLGMAEFKAYAKTV